MTLVRLLPCLLLALAVGAGLAACGSAHRAPTTTSSASTSTEVFRWKLAAGPNLYTQFRGPSEGVRGAAGLLRAHVIQSGGRMVLVQKPRGPEVCHFRAGGGVTTSLFGNRRFTNGLCTAIRKGLRP